MKCYLFIINTLFNVACRAALFGEWVFPAFRLLLDAVVTFLWGKNLGKMVEHQFHVKTKTFRKFLWLACAPKNI